MSSDGRTSAGGGRGLEVDPSWLGPVTLRVDADCPGYALSHARVRSHVVTIDEPAERGGGDAGPAPTETFVAALAGVANVILRRLARRDGIAVRSLSVETRAVLDRRGVWLHEALPTPWTELRQRLVVDTDADDARLALWADELVAFSPLHSVLATAGTAIVLEWARP